MGITAEEAMALNQMFGLKKTNVFVGKKVSIISNRKIASLAKMRQDLEAAEVVQNEKEADVYLVDNALAATFKGKEGSLVLSAEDYRDSF
jgi:hypothetical protein